MPDWKKLKKYYSELEKLEYEAPTKKQLITELKEAVQELKAIEPGTQKPRPLAETHSHRNISPVEKAK